LGLASEKKRREEQSDRERSETWRDDCHSDGETSNAQPAFASYGVAGAQRPTPNEEGFLISVFARD
jgi:hypothetical protein